ncbi:uncharacterized protein LOC131023930 [Salvia miltiorrhiza]|uniref:uncharacterized protein LOC131023930 n=1 Tax=Salvia miltiorrhiza TaxID=226208 RepID=UPI0025AB9434|nr:uncharacterized protein LOC131023930 [Salvia miltiorrhiza]
MAVDSGAASNQLLKSPNKLTKSQKDAPLSPKAKRNNSPGIRLVGGRIYDSVNGKTCHQCRQKTRDFTAACKNQKNNKPCTIMYCHKCLLNRYGEKAEEVDALGEWSCPKCRSICNCSVCMKKRGHQPTGILIKTAKATGFSSVSEMLLKGAQHLNCEKVVAKMAASPKKQVAPSPRKRGKENSFDGKVDANLPIDTDKNSKKVKKVHKGNKDDQSPDKRKLEHEAFAEMYDRNKKHEAEGTGSCGAEKSKQIKRGRSYELENKKDDGEILKEKSVNDVEKKPKKSKKGLEKDDSEKSDIALARRTSPRKLAVTQKISDQEAKLNVGVNPKEINITGDEINSANTLVVLKQHSANIFPDIPMPLGTELNNVAGIDVSTEDVGNALQFLEFCAAFGKILEVKKGQPEHVLQDLFNGRAGRRGKFSVTVQFHIHLLSILKTEQGEECGELSPSVGKNSWFNALKNCFSESQSFVKAQGLDCLERASDYESLEPSEKLGLLNFLCDEILETEKVRSWMDEQNTEFAEKAKEARQNVIAAKQKEKSLKQKMKDDVAKAIIAKHGAPLSISEHEAIVSNIKRKAAEAHAKVLESKGMLVEKSQTCNAVRIEPFLVGHGGNAYWKLNCFGNVLHQDVGMGDTLTLNEKWFAIDDEGKEAIQKHICSLRGKRLRF